MTRAKNSRAVLLVLGVLSRLVLINGGPASLHLHSRPGRPISLSFVTLTVSPKWVGRDETGDGSDNSCVHCLAK